jgi:hypothetical protein
VIGVPATADVLRLVRFLHHKGDLWVPVGMGEKAVDIDFGETACERDVLLGRQPLVPDFTAHDN